MDWQKWLDDAASIIQRTYGIEPGSAPRFALLLAYFHAYGLNPRITSGYRSQAQQDAMRKAWDAGQRQGLRVRPAQTSKHTSRKAMDITTSDDHLAARIAKALGLRDGLSFSTPDPGHYDAG